MLSVMHLVFTSRLVVVLLLQFVVFVIWVVDRLSRVSLLHHVKWLWCLLLFSISASEACYLLGSSGDCWRRAAWGSFYRSSSSWWWCWWCREWIGGCAWRPGEWRWFRGCWRIRGRPRHWRRVGKWRRGPLSWTFSHVCLQTRHSVLEKTCKLRRFSGWFWPSNLPWGRVSLPPHTVSISHLEWNLPTYPSGSHCWANQLVCTPRLQFSCFFDWPRRYFVLPWHPSSFGLSSSSRRRPSLVELWRPRCPNCFKGNEQGKFSQHQSPHSLCGQPQLGARQQNCEGCSSLYQC